MKTKNGSQVQVIVPGLILALLMNPLAYAMAQEPSSPRANVQNEETQSATSAPDTSTSSGQQLPDSPGATQNQAPVPPMPPQQQTQGESQFQPKEPVGTAAAETVPTTGVAASRPAGAALAPAKQRRVRTILIRMGAVIGVGAAVGVTMALSEASPSRPPGAH
jgi:hypothetical protein